MNVNELKKMIRAAIKNQIKEAKQKAATSPITLAQFRKNIAAGLKKCGAPQDFIREVGDVGYEGGGVFEAIWDTWRNIEAELEFVSGAEKEATYRDVAPGYVHDMVLDMVDAYNNAYNYEPGRRPSKIDASRLAVDLEEAMFPAPVKSSKEKVKELTDVVAEILEDAAKVVSNVTVVSPGKVTYDVIRSDYIDVIGKIAQKTQGLKPVGEQQDDESSYFDNVTGLTVEFGDGVATIK